MQANVILQGDVLDRLRELPEESVHCVITSPPYWGLRDYGVPGQIGLEPTVQEYIDKMVVVFREVRRVLRKDGLLFLNMGDSYAGSGKGRNADGEHNHKCGDKSASNRGAIAGTIVRSKRVDGGRWGGGNNPRDKRNPDSPLHTSGVTPPPGLKEKDLVGVPWELALALRRDGWWLRRDIIWHKPNAMPESTPDRATTSHEYIFHLAKNGAEPCYWTHQDGRGSRRRPKPDFYVENGMRFNRWTGHANFYDGVAIAEPLSPDVLGRPYRRTFSEERPDNGFPREESHTRHGSRKPPAAWQRNEHLSHHGEVADNSAAPVYKSGNKERKYRGDHGGVAEDINRGHQGFGVPWEDTGVGRNARSVWSIPAKGFAGAHFATFPEEVVRRCLLAGTSERGCCAECGAQVERKVDVEYDNPGNRTTNGPRSTDRKHIEGGTAGYEVRLERVARTTGWGAGCECLATMNPSIVLDPFMGAGTVALVAAKFGRRFLGIELNPEYVALANKRLADSVPLFTGAR